MSNVLIAFYSRDGAVEALANAMAEGAMAAGAGVRLRRARDIVGPDVMALVPGWADRVAEMNARYEAPTPDDALWADAIAFGSPTHFGLPAAPLKAFIDSLGALWARGKLVGKVGTAFTSSSTLHGGNEVTSLALYAPMVHFGMIIAPPGYGDPAMFKGGTPYGASSVGKPTAEDLNAARYQGQMVASVARALRAAKT